MKAKILRRKWFCLSEKGSSEDRVFLPQEGSLEEDIVKRRMVKEGEKRDKTRRRHRTLPRGTADSFPAQPKLKKEDTEAYYLGYISRTYIYCRTYGSKHPTSRSPKSLPLAQR